MNSNVRLEDRRSDGGLGNQPGHVQVLDSDSTAWLGPLSTSVLLESARQEQTHSQLSLGVGNCCSRDLQTAVSLCPYPHSSSSAHPVACSYSTDARCWSRPRRSVQRCRTCSRLGAKETTSCFLPLITADCPCQILVLCRCDAPTSKCVRASC